MSHPHGRQAQLRAQAQPRELHDARSRLLSAARRLFARSGYDGTSVREITRAARVNLSAVTYYFGAKHVLYSSVLADVIGPLASRIEFAMRGDQAPLEKIETAVRVAFDHMRSNPDMPGLMTREMTSGRAIAPIVLTMMKRALPALAGAIAEGQQDGTIRPGDPVLLALSTVAQPVYLNLARRGISAVTGLDSDDQDTFGRLVEHAVTTVRAALERR